jgi:hypothetical protein
MAQDKEMCSAPDRLDEGKEKYDENMAMENRVCTSLVLQGSTVSYMQRR